MAVSGPSWEGLYSRANGQAGYFTTRDASGAGFSAPLLSKHVHAGRVTHTRRGIYRLVQYPASDHEELVVPWLWSEKQGVFSHQTALALHDLSDVLPSKSHLTLPSSWTTRRLRVPDDLVVHYGDVPKRERSWFGPVPATAPLRTLEDCTRENLAPELLRQAASEALRRGLVAKRELANVRRALHDFGGLRT